MSKAPDSFSLPSELPTTKSELRAYFRTQRARRSRDKDMASERVFQRLLPLLSTTTTLAAYCGYGHELDLTPYFDQLKRANIRILLPRLGTGFDLTWAWYDTPLHQPLPHRPREPQGPPCPPQTLCEAQTIVVPALALDKSGVRLGQGAGWYDRMLRFAAPDAHIVGICEDIVDEGALPRDDHDIVMTHVLSPDTLIVCPH